MKNLTKILLAQTLIFSISPKITSEDKTIKDLTKEFAKIVLYNRIREEKETSIFQVNGNSIEYKEEIIEEVGFKRKKVKEGEITYSISKDKNSIYFSIYPTKNKEKERVEFDNYYLINERTKLAITYPKENQIILVEQQGDFIKQDPWKREEIEQEKKGLIELEKHEEATKVLEIGEEVLKKIVSKGGNTVLKKYEEFIEKSKQKEKDRINYKINSQEKKDITIILTSISDKITGQKMISLEYKISFKEEPKEITIYSMIGLDEKAIIHKILEMEK